MKHTIKRRYFLFFLLMLIVLAISTMNACKKEREQIDVSVFQNISPTEQWAVVKDSYVSFYEEPSKTSSVRANGRRGDVKKIQGEKWIVLKNAKEKWYLFEDGWLEQSSIAIYANAFQAEKASEKLLGK